MGYFLLHTSHPAQALHGAASSPRFTRSPPRKILYPATAASAVMQSSVQRIKLVQPLRQCLGIFLIYHVPGVSDDLQLRPPDVSGQKAGRFQVRAAFSPQRLRVGHRISPSRPLKSRTFMEFPRAKVYLLSKAMDAKADLGRNRTLRSGGQRRTWGPCGACR